MQNPDNAISTIFGRRENAHLTVDEEVIYMSEEITPKQSSLLKRPNFAQYPTEQELSDSKDSELSQKSKEDAEENKKPRLEKSEGKASKVSAMDALLRDALADVMRESGIEVITDNNEVQRVLDRENKKTPLIGQPNRANEKPTSGSVLASIRRDSSSNPTTSKQASAKVKNDTQSAKNKIKKYFNGDFLISKTDVNKAFADFGKMFAMQDKGGSRYSILQTNSGKTIAIRISNHTAKGDNFKQDNADSNLSIVIEQYKYDNATDSNVEYTEVTIPYEAYRNKPTEVIDAIVNGVNDTLADKEFSLSSELGTVEKKGGEQANTGNKNVRFFRTANGEAYGFTVDGKVYLDPKIAGAETAIHEYTHLWATALKNANPKEWSNIVSLMKGTPLWDKVASEYPELTTDDELADEVLAHYSGKRGAERLRKEAESIANGKGSLLDKAGAISALERVKEALTRFWKATADLLHIHSTTAEEVADKVLADLLNGVNPNEVAKDKNTRFQLIGEQGAEESAKAVAELEQQNKREAEKKAEQERIATEAIADRKQRAEETAQTATAQRGNQASEEEVEFKEQIKPVGKGFFGNIYNQFKGKAKEAFAFLLKNKSGDLLGVFHRDDVGDIDLVWGDRNKNSGLDHIIEKHIERLKDFSSAEEAIQVIEDVINNGQIDEKKSKWDKVFIEKDGYAVVISKNVRNEKGEIVNENKNWVVTAFDATINPKRKEVNSSDVTRVTLNTNKGGRAVTSDERTSDSKDSELSQKSKEDAEENNIFAKENTFEYETEEGKTITYSSEARLKAYQPNLFDYDFSGDTETGKNGNSKTSPNGVQREGNPLLTRFAGDLNSKEGEFCHVERIFRESGSFDFTVGNKVESPEDVAFIFSQLETASVEHSFAVFVKDGNPIVVELCMGDYNSTSVNIPAIKEAYFRIKPDTVYFVHNHPSGNLIRSHEDVACLRTIERAINKKTTGIIVNLKTGRFGVFDSEGEQDTKTKNTPKQTKPLTIYTFDQQVFADDYDPDSLETTNSPQRIAAFIQSQRLGSRDKISLLVLNRALKIVANIHTKYKTLLSKGLADDIVHYINTFGGESAVVYGNGVINGFNSLQNTVKTISGNKFKILDAVHVDSEHSVTKSASYGDISESEVKYQKRDKQKKSDSKATEVSKTYALLRDALADVMRESGIEVITDNKEAQRVLEEENERVKTMSFGERYDYKQYPNGRIEPNLSNKEVRIKKADLNHEFSNFDEAKEWAKKNIVRTLNNNESGGKGNVRISGTAVNKYLSESAVAKSDSTDVHLAVLKALPNVIKESIDVETTPDFKKDENGVRKPGNQINKDVLIHRCYGAVEIDGKVYRVKITLKEYKDAVRDNKAYSYEATKIELLAGTLVGENNSSNPGTNNSISVAKLLKDVDMTYNPGVKVLEESRKRTDRLREQRVWHGTGNDFEAFDHSYMGSGEGQQVFGWGTYVTEVEGIGRGYAKNYPKKVLTFKGLPIAEMITL